MKRTQVLALAALAVMVAGCGGGGGGGSSVPATANSPLPVTVQRVDDWVTFAHDQARSGLQSQPTGIDRTTVGTLAARWQTPLGEPTRASPLVTGGFVYIATDKGNVYALDAATGTATWHTHVGASVRGTPALYDGLLFVPVYGVEGGAVPTGGAFVALDAATGALRWTATPPGGIGLVRGEPVVLNGVVYEGLAGGDAFDGCTTGGIMAFDERTGAVARPFYQVVPTATDGAGVWSPLSTDGATVFAGTGNACDEGQSTAGHADSAIALNPSLATVAWATPAFDPSGADEDVGGAVNVANRLAYVAGKSGFLYALDKASGLIAWTRDMHPWTRGGGPTGTATGDGTMIFSTGGEQTNPDVNLVPGCTLFAFDLDGNQLYTMHSGYVMQGYAAFVPGIGFVALDHTLIAFDAHTGSTLWSSGDLADAMYASPAIVPSGVYTVTNAGTVYAFSPNGRASSQHRPSAVTSAPRRTR